MEKVKYLICFIVCVFACPLVSNAECSYERQAELSRIASNVQFSYTYEIDNLVQSAIYNVLVTNVTNDIYIVDDYGIVISGGVEGNRTYQGNNNISFTIYSNDLNCRGQKISTQHISLPVYNKFYSTEVCKQNMDNELCFLWRNNEAYALSDFEKIINNNKQVQKDNDEVAEQTFDYIEFLKQNKLIIITIIVGAMVFSVVVLFLRKRRGDRK